MKTITEESLDFKTFEKTLFEIMCNIARELAHQYLLWRDESVMGLRDTNEYRLIGSRETTIKSLFGEIPYIRRYYKKKNGGYTFLLDEVMGIDGSFGLVSENLAEQIVNECADKSFRKAAETIGTLTGQHISAMGAWGVVQQYGTAVEHQESRIVQLSENGSVGHLGGHKESVVFDEYDDLWIPRQRARRRKPGTAAKGAKKIGKKLGKLPMHVGIAYTGWSQSKDGRYNTENKIAYASFGRASEFTAKFEALLAQHFDMNGVQQRVTNGDGESWIRTAAELNDSILQLDPFHRSQAVTKAIADKKDRKMVFDAIDEKDLDEVLEIICDLTMEAEEEKAQNKLVELYHYFNNNSDSFLTWQERGIDLPKPPEGVIYREMGVAESSNCLITQRMKNRRASWSERGANNMAKILCYRGTIGLDAILGVLPEPEPINQMFAQPLSAAKVPLRDGKGYGADWLQKPMPFEGAFRTHGRDAIRGMLRMKPVSQLSFI